MARGGKQKEKDAWEAFKVHQSKIKKKNIYTTFKKKSQQEKLLSAQGTFEMSPFQPWRMGPFLIELKWHCSTTFYEEKIIKILLNAGSQENRIRMEKGKKTKNSFKVMAERPWLIQWTKDYTVLRNRTIPTIKEHQSRREREEEKNWAFKICTI